MLRPEKVQVREIAGRDGLLQHPEAAREDPIPEEERSGPGVRSAEC